ncbi:unnamed protein product, partial [Symbiodinium microadriaticum]
EPSLANALAERLERLVPRFTGGYSAPSPEPATKASMKPKKAPINTEDPEAVRRRVRALQKKMREIEKLKQMPSASLDVLQTQKIDTEPGVVLGYMTKSAGSLYSTVLYSPREFFLPASRKPVRHTFQERSSWWRETTRICSKVGFDCFWIMCLDGNCGVGSLTSSSIGDLHADPEEDIGELFHALLSRCGAWLPSTFQDSFHGPGGTLVHKRSCTLARSDYLALPLSWRDLSVSGRVAPEVSAGHSVPDHFAVVISAHLYSCASRQRRAGRIDVQAILVPQNAAAVQDAIHQVPFVHWEVNVNDHAALVVDSMYRVLHDRFPLKEIRRACRADRNAYLAQLADEVEVSPASQVHVAVRKLLKPRRYQGFQPLPRLKRPDGSFCTTQDEVDVEWRRHFGSLEGGSAVPPTALVKDCLTRQSEWGVLETADWADLPTYPELIRALQAVNPHKAAGPDLLPPAICRRFAAPVASILWPLLLKAALHSSEPVGFKGGTLHHIPKPGAADRALASSQRGILVQPVFGKVLHRAFRRLPAAVFERQAAPLQIGGRKGMTYSFGNFLSRNFLAFARSQGISAALVFSDLAAAYYAVVREVVVGASLCAEPLAKIAESLSLPSDALQELQAHVLNDSVFNDDCTPVLQSLLREVHVDTWFHISQDCQVVRTRRGTRPGSCLADVVFNLLFEKVLARRGCFNPRIVPRVPWSGHRDLSLFHGVDDSPCQHVELQDISYADDHASCVVADAAVDLASSVSHVLGRSLDSISGHGLSANFGPRKTAALLAHRGPGSRAAKDNVFHKAKGKIRVLREFGCSVDVDVVPYYKHLGSVISFSGSMLPDVKGRVSRAKASFGEGRRKIFACPHIALTRRVTLFQQHVLSALLAGAGSWPTLCQGSWKLLESCLTSFCRQMVRIPKWADQRWTRNELFVACDLPVLGDLLHAERLRFLGQMARSGPDAVWAVLQHNADAVFAMRSACQWLERAVCATWPLPTLETGWPAWRDTMSARPKYWKGVIRRSLSWYKGCRGVEVEVDRFARANWDQMPAEADEVGAQAHACLQCKKAFRNAQTWASHASLQHGYRAPHYVAAEGHRCRACGSVFASIRRHRTHLQVSRRCLQSVLRADGDLQAPIVLQEGHVQSRALRGRGTSHLPPVEEDFVPQLLSSLSALDHPTDEAIFDEICKCVAPLPVLRTTLQRWISGLMCGATREAAEDVLLCLRADLLCDAAALPTDEVRTGLFRPRIIPLSWSPRPAGLPGLVLGFSVADGQALLDLEPGGGWRTYPFRLPPPLCVDFAGAVVQLPRPPLRDGVFGDAPSCSLRALRKHREWVNLALKWLSAVLALAKRGRRCLLDLSLVPCGGHPLSDWIQQACQAQEIQEELTKLEDQLDLLERPP